MAPSPHPDGHEQLKLAEERLHQALDAVGDGSFDWNVRSGEIFYSDRWYLSLGYERGDLGADPDVWRQLIHPEDEQLSIDALESHLAGHTRHFDCEFRLRSKTGEWRWTHGRGNVIDRDANGSPLRMVGTNTDITFAKQVQLNLDELEGHCRSIVDTAACIIIVIDSKYRIREWNPAAERIYGWTSEEVRGRDYIEWFVPEQGRADARDGIDQLIAGGEAFENAEGPIVTRDGAERDVLWNASKLVNSAGQAWAVVAVGQDITERNRVQRERDMARREAEVLRDQQA